MLLALWNTEQPSFTFRDIAFCQFDVGVVERSSKRVEVLQLMSGAIPVVGTDEVEVNVLDEPRR